MWSVKFEKGFADVRGDTLFPLWFHTLTYVLTYSRRLAHKYNWTYCSFYLTIRLCNSGLV